jgi:SAM-dependent methyltransferase
MIGRALALIRKVFNKLILGPLKYGRGDDYDAGAYWRDRLQKYGDSLKGPGHEGLSEQENRRMYEQAAADFLAICREEGVEFPRARVLEVGPATGFYTDLLAAQGVTDYTGLDITDVLFAELRARHPGFEFVQGDVTSEPVEGPYDLIVMIDVIEHIVKPDKLTAAMENLREALAPGGRLVLCPVMPESRRRLYYVASWSLDDLRPGLVGCEFAEPRPFRDGHIVVVRKGT